MPWTCMLVSQLFKMIPSYGLCRGKDKAHGVLVTCPETHCNWKILENHLMEFL